MSCVLCEEKNYTVPLPYLINNLITEYDISKANINVLYHEGGIDKETYEMLYNLPKHEREVYIGLMQKDNYEAYEFLSNGIAKFRKMFFEANNLDDANIVSIKNDAIFVCNKICPIISFDNITFVKKSEYNLFAKLGRMEVYYGYNPITDEEVLDVKGIRDDKLERHRGYFITFLCDIFYKVQNGKGHEAISSYSAFYDSYIKRKLDVGYYREFNAESNYKISSSMFSYGVMNIDQAHVQSVDMTTNLKILRDLYGILTDLYFSRR